MLARDRRLRIERLGGRRLSAFAAVILVAALLPLTPAVHLPGSQAAAAGCIVGNTAYHSCPYPVVDAFCGEYAIDTGTCNVWAQYTRDGTIIGRLYECEIGEEGFVGILNGTRTVLCSVRNTRLAQGTITPVDSRAPVGASGALLNLTMTDGRAPGYVTADRCTMLSAGPQSQSSGNHGTGSAIANLSVVGLDSDQRFCLYNQASVNLVVDVQGYFAPPAAGGQVLTPVPPRRILDTRLVSPVPLAAGSVTRVSTGIEAGTSAVLVNLTMVDGQAPGYITADRCSALTGGPQSKSSGNHGVAAAIANVSVVSVDTDGAFCIYNQQPVNLVVDLQGVFSASAPSGLLFTPSAPTRLIDTRTTAVSRLAPGSITRVETGSGASTTAVLVNLTMTDGLAGGYVTADKCSALTAGAQTRSNGNHGVLTAISNLAVVAVDADGAFCVYNQQPVNLVLDLQGTFSATGGLRFFPVSPTRLLDTRTP